MRLRIADLTLAVATWWAALPAAELPGESASLFQAVCATCHGARGEGKQDLFAPSIGGLPAWYVELQLGKFRRGLRGEPPDHSGAAMRSIALAIPAHAIPALATQVASLDVHPTKGEPPRDLEQIAAYYTEACAPCHRYNGHGERAFLSAPITLLPKWYVEASLIKFRAKIRGSHPQDEQGAKMHENTAHLSEETIRELAAYLVILAEKYPPGAKRTPRSP